MVFFASGSAFAEYVCDQRSDRTVACYSTPVSREHTMDTVITMGELVIALAALGVISKAIIGRLGELGLFQRSELQRQA